MLPIIDFSSEELKQGSSKWESVKAEVRRAFEKYGCFQALYDKIPNEVRQQVLDSTVDLFDLPLQQKSQDIFGRDLVGYIGFHSGRPLYESIGVENAILPQNVNRFTSKIFPNGNYTYSEALKYYVEPLSELDKTIRTMILESFGLEKYKDEHLNSVEYNLRFIKYKKLDTNETKIGLSPHTDKNLVTVLDQYGTDGLEVLLKDGDNDQWAEVNFSPNSYFIFVGEVYHAWSNGRLRAPYHKVTMNGNESRYTIGIFINYKPDYVVKAPEELVDEEHPKLYNPFEVSGLYAFFKKNETKDHASLKAYCGV